MATEKQIEANRRNAQKSCGPKSEESKAKVSQNALKHGLRSNKFWLAPWEDQAEFDALLAEYMESEQPADIGETGCVLRMVQSLWSAQRAIYLQGGCFTEEPAPAGEPEGTFAVGVVTGIDRQVRYHASHDRAYQRAYKELAERRKQREKAEIGFVRAQRAEAEEIRKGAAEIRKEEKHKQASRLTEIRTQREEIRLMKDLGPMLPPNCTPEQFARLFSPPENMAKAA